MGIYYLFGLSILTQQLKMVNIGKVNYKLQAANLPWHFPIFYIART